MLQIETDLEQIRQSLAKPEILERISAWDTVESYQPDPKDLHFKVGNGYVIYKAKPSNTLEMVSALGEGDLPELPTQGLYEQWDYLANYGFYLVYAIVCKDNARARFMCRAAGMKLAKDDEINIYTQVITDGSHRKNQS